MVACTGLVSFVLAPESLPEEEYLGNHVKAYYNSLIENDFIVICGKYDMFNLYEV
jgi:hypothetical protein